MFISAGSKFVISPHEAAELQLDPYVQNDMMAARFRHFHFPCTLPKEQKKVIKPCARCFAQWVVGGEQPILPLSQASMSEGHGFAAQSLSTATSGSQKEVALACEAILDWIETHGGELRMIGPAANLSALADALSWSAAFFPTCGRLVPFLRRVGICGDAADVITGVDPSRS